MINLTCSSYSKTKTDNTNLNLIQSLVGSITVKSKIVIVKKLIVVHYYKEQVLNINNELYIINPNIGIGTSILINGPPVIF